LAARPWVGPGLGSGRTAARPLPFQGFADQGEDAEHIVWGCPFDEPTEQAEAEPGDGISQVWLVTGGFFVRQVLMCRMGHGFGEVGGEYFGMEVLADGFGGFAGELFDEEAVLKELEGFLDAPAGMVKFGEVGGRVRFAVGEGGRQDLFVVVGQADSHQSESGLVWQ
jgi:hypothetical protein